MIRFLIKLSFFLFFVFIIISFFAAKPSNNHSFNQREFETKTSDVMMAFKETLNDLGKFCDRNREACKIGKSFLSSLSERARYGAKATYEYLGNILSNKNMAQFENISPNMDEKPTQKKNHPTFP
ncbi:DUF5330 domain-containing protein [Bartonella henselae]|uniref:Uncharacterized protein n=3 Tax=Bartonella henselae TaxID=38323 RepID=A0A0H3M2U6_BARHE|nr:DUF5330 domain-containing protein [Bartonella henselae]ATP12070.1 hypothetical protein BhenCHDE101_02385 [Bartonella henselae]MDM9984000.1 DUF5330 domain-containing protein [Bartonella henselae]MDM9985633.1 DUF5330 domain-containing protein [Bartonella henselae]MDM9987110.1 DUF5330 domain-containing protein [Bartonella henselae]MDM9988572.1 DUF5330 domain-containing protein [Bartonella henselae]